MKRAEPIFGIAATIFLIVGIIFRKMHWPAAGILMILAILLFNFAYLPLQLLYRWRKTETTLQRFYSIFKFVTFFIIVAGFVFKLMHWPGAGMALYLGTFLLPAYILIYFILRWKGQGNMPFMLNDLLMAIIAYGIQLFLTTTLVSPTIAMGYLSMENRYQRMNSGLGTSNKMIYSSLDSVTTIEDKILLSSINELQQFGERFYQTIDSLKRGFYKEVYGSLFTEFKDHHRLDPNMVASTEPGSHYFIERGNALVLKKEINSFRKSISEIASRHNLQSGLLGMGLGTKDFKNRWGDVIAWEGQMFERSPTGLVITNLSLIKQMVLLSEANLLNGLISQIDLSSEGKLIMELASKESEKAMMLKENEIIRVKQQQELQSIQLEQSQAEVKQNRMMAVFAFVGIALVMILLMISTRAYVLKQRSNKELEEQKDEISEKNDELSQQNEEIAAQRDEIEAQRDLVSRHKDQIERTHNELSASIDYATRLQASILPNTNLLKEHFAEHFIFFKPKQKVSGDFYWWTRVEGRLVIVAADCTGHGVPGAFMSLLGVSLLREIVNKENVSKPGVILNRLREEVIRSLDQKGEIGEQKDGMDLALISYDLEQQKCEYAGANAPLYLVREGNLSEFKPDRMPVSFYERTSQYTTHQITLQANDQLYMFSDGFADQFGGKSRKKFKYKAFQNLILEVSDKPMVQQKQILHVTMKKWQGDYEQIDDMVIVGLKMAGLL